MVQEMIAIAKKQAKIKQVVKGIGGTVRGNITSRKMVPKSQNVDNNKFEMVDVL